MQNGSTQKTICKQGVWKKEKKKCDDLISQIVERGTNLFSSLILSEGIMREENPFPRIVLIKFIVQLFYSLAERL